MYLCIFLKLLNEFGPLAVVCLFMPEYQKGCLRICGGSLIFVPGRQKMPWLKLEQAVGRPSRHFGTNFVLFRPSGPKFRSILTILVPSCAACGGVFVVRISIRGTIGWLQFQQLWKLFYQFSVPFGPHAKIFMVSKLFMLICHRTEPTGDSCRQCRHL